MDLLLAEVYPGSRLPDPQAYQLFAVSLQVINFFLVQVIESVAIAFSVKSRILNTCPIFAFDPTAKLSQKA
jgi:hypothetical protein